VAKITFDDLPDEKDARGGLSFDDLPDEKPAGPKKAEGGNPVTAAARGVVSGIPLVGPAVLRGLENVSAGAQSLTSGNPQAEELERIRAYGAASDKANPGSRLGGDIAGGVLGSMPLVLAAPAAFGAGAAPLVTRMAASGVSGMGLTGLDAATRAVPEGAAPEQAVKAFTDAAGPGAAIGGVAGTLGPVAMEVGQGVARAAAPYIGMSKFAGEDRVARALLNAQREPGSIAEGMERARGLGKGHEYTLADELGESGSGLAAWAARGPGPGRERVVEALVPRQRMQAERLAADLSEAMGTSGTAKQEAARLLKRAQDESRPIYNRSMAVDVSDNSRLAAFQGSDVAKSAMRTGAEIEANERLAAQLAGKVDETALFQPSERAGKAPSAPAGKPAPVAAGPVEKRPETMAEFIARHGGIELDGDFAHAGLDKFRVRSPDGKHAGNVARKGGHSLDGYWRVRLQEEGFLPKSADGYMERNVRDEVIDALLREQGGMPTYRAGDAGAAEAAQGAKNEAANAAALVEHTSRVRRELVELGVPERSIDKAALEEAAKASRRGEDGVLVYERLLETGMPDTAPAGSPGAGSAPAAPPGAPAPETITAAQYRDLIAGGGKEAAPVTMRDIQRARIGLRSEIDKAFRAGENDKAFSLKEVLKALDGELERANPEFLTANRTYAGPAGARSAITKGQKASHERPEDALDTFRGLAAADEQQGFRQGISEGYQKRLANAEGAGDRARIFDSAKGRALEEIALPGQGERFGARRELESRMSATQQRALGGSQTAANLANDAAYSGVLEALWAGNYGRAAMNLGRSALTASTPGSRDRVAELLLRTAAEGGEGVVDELTSAALRRRELAALIYQSMVGGARSGVQSAR
jgi:hypothetical protein